MNIARPVVNAKRVIIRQLIATENKAAGLSGVRVNPSADGIMTAKSVEAKVYLHSSAAAAADHAANKTDWRSAVIWMSS